MVTFHSIESEIVVAEGLSKPCVLSVTGNDGVRRKLIFKVSFHSCLSLFYFVIGI